MGSTPETHCNPAYSPGGAANSCEMTALPIDEQEKRAAMISPLTSGLKAILEKERFAPHETDLLLLMITLVHLSDTDTLQTLPIVNKLLSPEDWYA
jgi:hypothetical protein